MVISRPRSIRYTGPIITPGSERFPWVTDNQGLFVAVGGSYFDEPGVIVTSPDGILWKRRACGTRNNLYSVAFGNGSFIAVEYSGVICTSEDGLHWKTQRSGTSRLLSAVAAGTRDNWKPANRSSASTWPTDERTEVAR